MRCLYCGGNGKIGWRAQPTNDVTPINGYVIIPCPECEGTGIGSCCEGDLPLGPVIPEAQK